MSAPTMRPPTQTPTTNLTPPPAPGGGGGPLRRNNNRGNTGLFRTNTLFGRLQILAGVTSVLAVIALILCFFALNTTENNMRELVARLTPTLEASQRLGQAVEEMDARAADYQLTYRIDVSSPDFIPAVYGATGLRESLWTDLEQKQIAVDNALSEVRSRVTSPAETEAVNIIGNRFYEYFAQIRLMRYELDLGHKEAALSNYKAGQDILVGRIGNVPLDAQGNSQEKLLKDNNWLDVGFTCVTNCATGQQNKEVAVSFDPAASYLGITANIQKLTEINQQQLTSSGPLPAFFSDLLVIVSGLLILAVLAIAIFYAVTTHRLLNPGFVLAFATAIAVAIVLISTLNNATNDYRLFNSQYVRAITLTSVTQQLTADAGADISRLLLSPDSPGLDSTSPSLTTEVKKAFDPTTLQTAYATKVKQIEQELIDLWVTADTPAEVATLCPAVSSNNQRCPNTDTSWTRFQGGVKQIQDRFNRKLLAEAIQINITPNPDPAQVGGSARQSYNQFIAAIQKLGDQNKASFDQKACNALGESEFGLACGESGYINFLQVVIWLAFPLLILFMAGGIWYSSRLF